MKQNTNFNLMQIRFFLINALGIRQPIENFQNSLIRQILFEFELRLLDLCSIPFKIN